MLSYANIARFNPHRSSVPRLSRESTHTCLDSVLLKLLISMISRLPLLLLPLAAAALAQQAPPEGPRPWPTDHGDQRRPDTGKRVGSPDQAFGPTQASSGSTFPEDDSRCKQLPIYEVKDLAHTRSCSGDWEHSDERKAFEPEMEGEAPFRSQEVFTLVLNVSCTPGTRQHPLCYSCVCSKDCPPAGEAQTGAASVQATVVSPEEARASTDKKATSGRRKGRSHHERSSRTSKGAARSAKHESSQKNKKGKRDARKNRQHKRK
ncbi:uncharacterized protein LOC125035193 [Penaeus chinensis]|uniref:uncharacterized protein LOC125035193 n=1 Tax=Penaeus chinensis TaxID=139456 RepID=UPI001FB8528B|nr:uncharacterized protein LOC125035193 [Penaeus chinensis]